jgi:hypothetical protein
VCHAHGLGEAEGAYTALLLEELSACQPATGKLSVAREALKHTDSIESLKLAKRLLKWAASNLAVGYGRNLLNY